MVKIYQQNVNRQGPVCYEELMGRLQDEEPDSFLVFVTEPNISKKRKLIGFPRIHNQFR